MFGDERPDDGTPAPPPEEIVTDDPTEGGDGGDDIATEGGDEPKKVTISQQEYLALKTAREKHKADLAELERLKATNGVRTTTDNRNSEADDQRKLVNAREERLRKLRLAADSGNEDAQIMVDAVEVALESERRTLYRLEMQDIPESLRGDVKSFMSEHGVKSPSVALELVRGKKYPSLEAEIADLRKQLDEKSKPKPKVETRVVGAPKAKASNIENGVEFVTLAEYTARMDDPALRHGTRKARDAGKLKVRG